MEREARGDQPRLEMPLAQGCRLVSMILYVLILFFLIACIMILLIVLNRSGWFALLSAFFGALIYCALTLPRVLFGMRQASLAPRQGRDGAAGMHARRTTRRPTTLRGTLGGLLLFSLLGTAAFVGLYFLPSQGPVFVFPSSSACYRLVGQCLASFSFREEEQETPRLRNMALLLPMEGQTSQAREPLEL